MIRNSSFNSLQVLNSEQTLALKATRDSFLSKECDVAGRILNTKSPMLPEDKEKLLLDFIKNHRHEVQETERLMSLSHLPKLCLPDNYSFTMFARSPKEYQDILHTDELLSRIYTSKDSLDRILNPALRPGLRSIREKDDLVNAIGEHFFKYARHCDIMQSFSLSIFFSINGSLALIGKFIAFQKLSTILILHNHVLDAGLAYDLKVNSDFILREVSNKLERRMLLNRSVFNSGAAEKVRDVLQSVKASIPEIQVYSSKPPVIPILELIPETPNSSTVSKKQPFLKDPRFFILATIGAFLALKSTKTIKDVALEVTKETLPVSSSFLKEFATLVAKNL